MKVFCQIGLSGLFRRFDRDRDQLESRSVRSRVGSTGDQNVAFGIIHGCVSGADFLKRGCDDVRHLSRSTADRSFLAGKKSEPNKILRMQQNDEPSLNSPVKIVVFVDNGIKLTFAANRHQPQFLRTADEFGQRMHAKLGFAGLRGKMGRVERPTIELKFLLGLTDVLDLLEPRDHFGDGFADSIGVPHRFPVDRSAVAENAAGDGGNDFDFAFGTGVTSGATVTEPDIIEHRFLGC